MYNKELWKQIQRDPALLAQKKLGRLRYRDGIKALVIQEYGGRCKFCGESDPDVLVIDHVNNDGAEERKKTNSARDIWLHLKRLGLPKENYQLLCANCNQKKMVTARRARVLQEIENSTR